MKIWLEYDWTGYTRLANIVTMKNGKIQIKLAKEADNGAV